MAYAPVHCALCPRRCGADRHTAPGLCGGGPNVRVARAAPHLWEEPCLSGTHGSGTVFFAGCGLGCVFCQNHAISRGGTGRALTVPQLAQLFLRLQAQGVHNLNLVTAAHYRPWVQAALHRARTQGLSLPVVYNTGGYETLQSVEELVPDVDIWLTDLKFFDAALAQTAARAPDYFQVASAAVQAICATTGPPVFGKDGLLQKGVILRLLVLPGHRRDAIRLLQWMAANLPKGGFLLSLMSQYTPPSGVTLPAPFHRRVSSYEYNQVLDVAVDLGLTQGYAQQRDSAQSAYTPPFDGTGV